MVKYRQPSLWASTTRSQVFNFFKIGGRSARQTKVHSGGVQKVSRRYTLGGSMWDRKKSSGKRRIF